MQSEQLAYAIVTSYSMRKSRTGGILGRLISRTGLDLVGGRMFAPGAELTKRYADTLVTETDPRDRAVSSPPATQIEKTLVLIKPDNFRFPNLRPGGVIEVFSRTGLSIIGFKVHQMSVAQAEEFYGPVLPVLEKKLGPKSGRENWESIIEFMAGKKPSECHSDERDAPGTEKSIAIVYQGVDAVRKIRDVLGPTDPAKAPPGSIRKEFGQTIMVNAAHASDSVENAKREMAIIRVEENNFKPLIENFYRRS